MIIRDALLGRRRFGEFQRSLGLAKNILTLRLRTLVDRGILKMAPASDGTAYQEYLLTPKGRGVFPILVALRQWSEAFGRSRKRPAGAKAGGPFAGRTAARRCRHDAQAAAGETRPARSGLRHGPGLLLQPLIHILQLNGY